MSIEWAEPPGVQRTGRRGTVITSDIVTTLRANPRRWACIAHGSTSPATAHLYAKRHPEFEGVVRRVGKDERGKPLFDLYLRYVGEESTS